MSLVKTSLLNSIAVAVKVASALVLNKILAVYVGPAGYAIIGQFQNAVSIVVSLAGGLIGVGVTKSTAQNFDDEAKQHRIWQTAIRFSLWASLVAGLVLLLLGSHLSEWLLHRADMSSVFVWLALALPAMATNTLLLAIVNGKKEVRIYVAANIIGSLLVVSISGLLAYTLGLYGALIAFTVSPAIALLSTTLMITKRQWFDVQFLWGKIDYAAIKELTGLGLMSITAAITMPVTFIFIRDYLENQLGIESSGYWQASWKISEIYLMLVTTTLSVYYLPRLAEIRSAIELKAEIIKVYRFVLPLAIVSAISMFVLRDFIINTLFTDKFFPMRVLFPWQLAGDVIKIGSWVLSYVMLGRAMVKPFIIAEVGFSLMFYGSCRILVEWHGLTGASMAYALSYLIYWIGISYLLRRAMRRS